MCATGLFRVRARKSRLRYFPQMNTSSWSNAESVSASRSTFDTQVQGAGKPPNREAPHQDREALKPQKSSSPGFDPGQVTPSSDA